MATQPTDLPVPSESPRDLKFNAGKIDEFVTSLVNTYTDRFGNEHYTIEGLRWLAQQAIAQYGWIPFGTFQEGATLTLPNQILKDETDGEYYRWDGAFPKSVPVGSIPDITGGVGVGAWVSIGDAVLRTQLSNYDGFKLIGKCPDLETLRTVEPEVDRQVILVDSHTAGYGYGGGRFIGYLDGSSYTDDKGYVIKTSGGSVWLRQSDTEIKAVNFGYIVGDSTKAVSNAEAVVAAANYSFNKGGVVVLPKGTSYVDNIILDLPVTIKGAHPGSGASLVQREQSSDLVHTGNGYCFDFPPKVRPTIPTDTQPVTDGIRLMNLNIRGTNAGLGGIRINTAASIGIVGNERRNTTFMNINISGYYSGWGFEMFNTFTNHLQNVTVWDCAAPYYIRTAHSTDHVSCVYENCAWGCLAINTECNNHIGGTIEGIRYLTKMTQPVDYDENGNFPTDTGYVQLYAGIGMRTRGGTTNLNGVYLEANKIDLHLEDACKITMRDCYINALATRTDYTAIGTSGRLVVENCRFSGTPSRERWHPNSASLLCSHAIIIHNHYQNDASRPVSTPTISNVGEFDVYPGTPDTNAITRIWKGQGSYSSVNTGSATLTVDSDVTMAGLSLTVPTVTGRLYRDSNGFVKWKQ